jgi:spore coat polysaccharide biosynthesis predicted glycosyltransferase SpsG
MLREPFRVLDEPRSTHPPTSVLVTVGGSDLADIFADVLDITVSITEEATVNAVVGPYFEPPTDAPDGVVFHNEPSEIHELMWEADLAVSGGGQTLYELAVCGTPAVALTLGDDQIRNIAGFKKANVCLSAGRPADPEFEDILSDHLTTLYQDCDQRREMQMNGTSLVDGDGVLRVADHVEP